MLIEWAVGFPREEQTFSLAASIFFDGGCADNPFSTVLKSVGSSSVDVETSRRNLMAHLIRWSEGSHRCDNFQVIGIGTQMKERSGVQYSFHLREYRIQLLIR